jgi:acyl-CoA thioester hydrolase
VRFYVEKHWQTLCGGIGELTVEPQLNVNELLQKISVQHIRFLQECRLAAPLSGYIGVVYADSSHMDVLTELRQSFTDELVSACIHRFAGLSGDTTDDLPQHAAPRGLADQDLPHTVLSLADVESYGFKTIGMGIIQASECTTEGLQDGVGIAHVHNYMARLSDSMPHLWGLMRAQSGQLEEHEGGAVLEYRMRYHRPLKMGERFILHSGLNAVSAKVQRFAHLMFSKDQGDLCVSAEAVGVRMDLLERRAKVLSGEMRAHMSERLIRPIGNTNMNN